MGGRVDYEEGWVEFRDCKVKYRESDIGGIRTGKVEWSSRILGRV
jgi:hypothetical protein